MRIDRVINSQYVKNANFIPILLCAFSGLSLLLLFAPAWPMNHEADTFFFRTIIYSDHIRQGDFLPVWSSLDNYGLGSPQPVWYHKLFYLVSGLAYAISGALKESVFFSIWFFLTVGSFGMYSLGRSLGFSRSFAFCSALMFITANYTVTNWLVRGAMAEFSGAMLVPYCLVAYFNFIQNKYNDYIAGPMMGVMLALVYLAHSVLAFYLVLLLGFSTGILIVFRKILISWKLIKRVFIGAIVFLIIVSPYLYIIFILKNNYDISRIVPENYLPERHLIRMAWYLWDPKWQWGRTWDAFTVQFDTPVLLLCFAGILFSVFRFFSNRKKLFEKNSWSIESVVMISIVFLSLFLQLRLSLPFYRYFPGAKFIQFPWRLLAVLTPALIVSAIMIWQHQTTFFINRSRLVRSGVVVAVTVVMIIISGAWRPLNYETINVPSSQEIGKKLIFSAFNEYVPVSSNSVQYSKFDIYSSIKENGCDVTLNNSGNTDIQDRIKLDFDYECRKSGIFPLPLFASPLHHIKLKNQLSTDQTSVPLRQNCLYSASFPGLCMIEIARPGLYRVEVHNPTISGIFNK